MTQNIYDDEGFFASYSQLRRSVEGLAGAPEWPSLRALLPGLTGKRVLDLGCGMGWFCRWAAESGATWVTGIDVSTNMLSRAREMTPAGPITYEHHNLDEYEPPAAAFDVVYSSLALHYLAGIDRLFAGVYRSLKVGGSFVFSVEHPIYTAPRAPGWVEANGRETWPVDSFLDEGARSTDWLAKGVIKQHRTTGTYVNTLVRHGFVVEHLEDWGPTHAQVAEQPELAIERERPAFLLIKASRRE